MKKTRDNHQKEAAQREEKWERNRKRRKMLTDSEAYQIIGATLRAAGIKSRIYTGPGVTPLAPKSGHVYTFTRSHRNRVHPCGVMRHHRYTIPGLGSGNSGEVFAHGRTWESCIVDLRRVLRESKS